jgi:hypothetical protein
MKMSRISLKARAAALLVAVAVASTGIFAPPPAQAYPTCQDIVWRECNRYYQGQYLWQRQGYDSAWACYYDQVEMTCGPQYYGALEGVREDQAS